MAAVWLAAIAGGSALAMQGTEPPRWLATLRSAGSAPVGAVGLRALALGAAVSLLRPRTAWRALIAWGCLGSAAVSLGATATLPPRLAQLADEPGGLAGPWRVRARLLDDPEPEAVGSVVTLAVSRVRVDGIWRNWQGRVRVRFGDAGGPGWPGGSGVETFLRLRADRAPDNPGAPAVDRLARAGLVATAHLHSWGQLRRRSEARWPRRARARIRARIRRAIEDHLGDQAPLAHALLLGERGLVTEATALAYAESGLGHLLAISGLHVGFWLATAWLLAAACGLSPRGRAAAGALALCGILLIVRAHASVLRATCMAAAALSARARGGNAAALDLLASVAFLLAWWQPGTVRDLGFRLSLAATAAVLLAARPAARTPFGWLGAATRASLAAQVATAPLVAPLTASLPLATAPLNLLAVPLAGLAVTLLGGVAATHAAGADALADALGTAANGTLLTLTALARAGREGALAPVALPGAHRWLAAPWWLGWLAASAAGADAPAAPVTAATTAPARDHGPWRRALRRPARTAGVALLAAVALVAWRPPPPPPTPELWALDVGQGDALLLRERDTAVLVDGGGYPGVDYDLGARVLAPALRRLGVRRLAAIVLTHAHADHAGGLPGVLERLPAGAVWFGPIPPWDPRQARLLDAARRARIPALTPRGDWPLGACSLRVLGPNGATALSGALHVHNDASLVLAARCGRRRLLLTGDAGLRVEGRWSLEGMRGALLKVGHHGSRGSTGEGLLGRLRPRHALLSVGARNLFGLPTDEVVERLRDRGVAVYRTDRDGALRVRLGRRLRVSGSRWRAG